MDEEGELPPRYSDPVYSGGNHGGHGGGDCLQEEMEFSASDTHGGGDGGDEEAMDATVTVSHGGMGRLLRQLRSLKATSIDGVIDEKDLQTFKDILERLCGKLKHLAEVESPSYTAKGWMEEMRNLCYDTEDYLDKVTQSAADVGESDLIKAHHRGKPKRQRQFAADFSVLRARARGAQQRYKSLTIYSLPAQSTKPASAELSVLDNTNRDDIHKHTDDLVELIDFDAPKQFKVVAILGFAGVGKTTLARRLYDKYGARFEYCAFVRVSRNPDLRRLLISMLSQIKGERAHVFSDVHDLLDNINGHLQQKRYLIVIDDLWASITWDMISRALPRDNDYSRIIITTQTEDVAMGCCSYDSRDVFKIRPCNYLQSCGEPFETTIMVDNLLRHNLTEAQPWHLQISLLSGLRTNPTSEGMKELLDHIYGSLPHHLKTCLLHFNMYPEDYTIKKDDLVKQWVAEGFIGEVNEQDRFKVAEGYFHELTRRGLIQEVDTNYNNDELPCTVHHIVMDFIRYKSEEESFISIADYLQTTPGNPDRIRRLSVQFGGSKGAKIPGSVRMSQLRSLAYFGFFNCVPSIAEYILLRVLILHVWADKDKTNFDLSSIQELFRLRYLKIACNVSVKLPTKIRWLQYLETLDIDARVVNFPSDIVHLKHLLHLRLPREINMPREIDKMTSLCSLAYFQLSRDSVLNLGKLANLQDLHLICYKVKSDRLVVIMKSLGSIMEKFSKLKTLVLDAGASTMGILCDGLSNVPSPPHHLQKLKFSPQICIFPSLPEWIGKLNELAILKIAVKDLSRNNIEILKRLTGLTILSLSVQTAPAERAVFDEGFQALRYFKFACTAACLSFVQGAMVNVERLKLCFNADTIEQYDLTSVGFQYLTSLQEISVKFGDPSSSRIRNAKTALDAAVSKNPNTTIVNVQTTEGISFGDKEKNVSPQITNNLQSPGRQGIITRKDSVELVVREKEESTTAEKKDQIKKELELIEGKDTDTQGDQENISSEEDTYNQDNSSRENEQTALASVVGKHPTVQSKEGISHGDKDKNVPVPKTNLQASDTQCIITDEDSDEHQISPGGTNLQAPKRLSTITQEDSSRLDTRGKTPAEKVTHQIPQEPILEGHIPWGQGVTVQRATEEQRQMQEKHILSEDTDNSRSFSSLSKVISGLPPSNPDTILAAAVTVNVQSTEGISYGDKPNKKIIQNTNPQASGTPDIITDNDSDEQGDQKKDASSTEPSKGKHQTLRDREEAHRSYVLSSLWQGRPSG